jgi:hypothetical protein
MKKAVAGTVIAAGFSVAGMLGAGTASALGFAVDPAGPNNSFSIGTASADVGDANNGLAVSVFSPASVQVNGKAATGNTLIAVDGSVTVDGKVTGGTFVNVGSHTKANGAVADNTVSLVACNFSFTGQAAHVTTSHGIC